MRNITGLESSPPLSQPQTPFTSLSITISGKLFTSRKFNWEILFKELEWIIREKKRSCSFCKVSSWQSYLLQSWIKVFLCDSESPRGGRCVLGRVVRVTLRDCGAQQSEDWSDALPRNSGLIATCGRQYWQYTRARDLSPHPPTHWHLLHTRSPVCSPGLAG